MIRRKTAVLFQGACRIGASLNNVENDKKSALDTYGLHLGLAFQMADDLLDYLQQDLDTLGKKAGADLREGKMTLPVIYTLKNASPADRSVINAIITHTDFSTDEFKLLIELMEKYGGLAYTRKKAKIHSESAKDALNIFPHSKTRDILMGFAYYTLTRKA